MKGKKSQATKAVLKNTSENKKTRRPGSGGARRLPREGKFERIYLSCPEDSVIGIDLLVDLGVYATRNAYINALISADLERKGVYKAIVSKVPVDNWYKKNRHIIDPKPSN